MSMTSNVQQVKPDPVRDDLVSASNVARPPSTYDELVRRSPQGSIFANRWWLDAVAPGMYELLEINKGGEIHAAWPVVHILKDGARHACMPALTQKLGILFAPSTAKPVEIQSTNHRLAGELIEKLGDLASFQQNFHENFTDWLPFFWQGHTQTTRYTYVLEDISDRAVLWNAMRPHQRRAIRKAEKLSIRIKDDLDLSHFLELNRKTFTRQGKHPLGSDELIGRLDSACRTHAGRKIFAGIDSQGRVHAAVYVAWANDTAYYLMGGSEPDLRASGAQLLALWEAVVFAGSVVRRFDFEGSMLPQVEHVFRGFGAKQLPYFSITKMPPTPESLSGFLRASLRFRWNRAYRSVSGRFRFGKTESKR